MVEPITLIATVIIAKHGLDWLHSIQETLLSKGKEYVMEQGKERWHAYRDEQQQVRQLVLALENAAERGSRGFEDEEREHYRIILKVLFADGEKSAALRQEAMSLFTLADEPDYRLLSEKYNLAESIATYAREKQSGQPATHEPLDASPYLRSFFEALLGELYRDPLFRMQMSQALVTRASVSIPRSLAEIAETLRQLSTHLTQDYTTAHFEQNLAVYTAWLQDTFQALRLKGIVPKDQGQQNMTPDLNAMFVPLRLAVHSAGIAAIKEVNSIVPLLEASSYLVLLGGPGAGKSTLMRFLTWSHAAAHHDPALLVGKNVPLLVGNPLPLRIELRLLSDARRRVDYSFLTYVTEVQLKHTNPRINPRLFEVLLTRKAMLLIFDGLDEVATLEERTRLVEEIEEFSRAYPGNHIVVTSRPVGYELASFSKHWWAHAALQPFDNEEIRAFLERWYAHVLQLIPLPPEDQEELESLYKMLKKNSRLHRLAENPLLLTVIANLHRYERLPDRRAHVYDSCAKLLLDTWAKIKGTDVRWHDMQMSRETQFSCLAHLGYVLHARSQEEQTDQADHTETQNQISDEAMSDLSAKEMLQAIKAFLEEQDLFSKAERSHEAEMFLELAKVEAGLIVERGTNTVGDALYGFVHRTFQEFFAAASVAEEDPMDISKFLDLHLHDPHWHEVLLLLFGKLNSKKAGLQLRHILQGHSRRSMYKEILRQDLFFACACLAEEITVENQLVETLLTELGELVVTSPFPMQRAQALDALAALMQTRSYEGQARKTLTELVEQCRIADWTTSIKAAQILYRESPRMARERQIGAQRLLQLVQQPECDTWQVLQMTDALSRPGPAETEAWQLVDQLLKYTAQHPHVAIERILSDILRWFRPHRRNVMIRPSVGVFILWQLVQKPELSPEQTIAAARALYQYSPRESKEYHQATEVLWQLVQKPELSPEQTIAAVQALYDVIEESEELHYDVIEQPEELRQANLILLNIAQNHHNSRDQRLNAIKVLLNVSSISYAVKMQEMHLVSQLLPEEEAKLYIDKHIYLSGTTTLIDIPILAQIASDECMPIRVRDGVYKDLCGLLPKFSIASAEENQV